MYNKAIMQWYNAGFVDGWMRDSIGGQLKAWMDAYLVLYFFPSFPTTTPKPTWSSRIAASAAAEVLLLVLKLELLSSHFALVAASNTSLK